VRHVVDSHLHLWERDRHAQPWIDPDTMGAINQDFPPARAEAELAARGVEGCVVVQGVNTVAETRDLLADLDGSRPARGVVGWVDLTGDVPAQVAELRAAPGGDALVGVRHVTFVEDEDWLARADVGRGLTDLGEAGLSFDILIGHRQLPLAAAVAREHESTSFVLDHLGKVPMTSTELVTWSRGLSEVASCPNVVAKVSGVVTEDDWIGWSPQRLRPGIDHALATFGPERLMFGSDWPLVELAGGYGAWLDAYLELTDDLTPHERDALDKATAVRVYRLERA